MLHKISLFFTGVLISLLSICSLSAQLEPHQASTIQTVQMATTDTVNDYSDSIRTELVRQTDAYISQKFPKSKLTGEALVMACEKHDFDICFALAQAEIESGLGTAGKAKRTNNPWNVGAWNGRSVQTMNKLGYGYSHPDQSIEPYIELVKTKYLGDKRTIHDLMVQYTTLSGHRYASDPDYERTLKSTYHRICTKTALRELQDLLKRVV